MSFRASWGYDPFASLPPYNRTNANGSSAENNPADARSASHAKMSHLTPHIASKIEAARFDAREIWVAVVRHRRPQQTPIALC
jgi:hypothetical protein